MYERVNPSHVDKIADRIAGAIVDFAYVMQDNPKIAVAAYLENAGFGATWACPIASLMIEKYLTGTVRPERLPVERRMKETVLIH